MVSTAAQSVLVRIQTDEDLYGWGEATPLHSINGESQGTAFAACRDLARLLIGREAMEWRTLVEEMEALMPGQSSAASAIEMAILDVVGQSAELPIWKLLGGSPREIATDQTIGIKPASDAVAQAHQFVAEGHQSIKIKVGSTLREDLERVQSVREAIGTKFAIRIDANQGYRRDSALRMLEAMAPYEIQFCEQPVPRADLDGMGWVARRSPIAIMADESVFGPEDALALAKNTPINLFNVKLSKSRGILRGLEIASIARAARGQCMIGGMIESRIGMTAAAHMAYCSPVFQYFDLDSFTGHAEDPMIGGAVIQNGSVVVPETPGLGIRPDPTWVAQFESVVVE